MSADGAVNVILASIEKHVAGVASFRATVTAVDGALIKIRREGAVTADTQQYATTARDLLAVGDVVLCLPLGMGGKPVILDVIRRAAAATPTAVKLTAAGTTATNPTVVGNDNDGTLSFVPGGAGITTGDIIALTFAVARPSTSYRVLLAPASSAAQALGGVVGRSGRTTTVLTLATATALTSGSTYAWDYSIKQYA